MKINKKLIIILSGITFMCTSCRDWLDIKPEDEVYGKDLFSSYQGFKDALNGCYMALADCNAYGERLTMSNVESLAAQWNLTSDYYRKADYYFLHHNYTQDDAKNAIKTIYSQLFNVITQANMIIGACEQYGNNIADPASRAMIEGEAYGIRAFCQLDILRLFGQLPQNATLTVSLPYSESADIKIMPVYYSFEDYVKKLDEDLDKACSLLKDYDLIFKYTFDQLNTPSNINLNDDYLAYRQLHFNYWGVKALKARLYLYIGDVTKAHDNAMEIINAKGADGKSLMKLSGREDLLKGLYACPSECLLAIHKYNLRDYSPTVLGGDADRKINPSEQLCLNGTWNLQRLFTGFSITSHNRYIYQWELNTESSSNGQKFPTLKKYYSKYSSDNDMVKGQIIPLLRISELYLIAMETTTSLEEANALYKEYMASHDISISAEDSFTSLDAVANFILAEYQREFYAEGVMFYQYKRRNSTSMTFLFGETMNEGLYVLPLPETEYNPNAIQ